MADRVRMNTVALSTVALAQGPSFWHAGTDLLRSKSLDRNTFRHWVAEEGRLAGKSTEDGAATLTAITAASVARAVSVLPRPPTTWIVAGGGTRNPTLMRMIAERLAPANVETAGAVGWSADALEAQAFAYLAVRTLKPTSPDLISRHLTKRSMGLYATPGYLKARGMPQPGNGLAGHDIVIYQASVAPRHQEKICHEPVHNARVAMEVNSGLAMIDAARLGMGVAELPCHMADGDKRLVRIWPERVDHYDVWLVMHADLSRSARVRAAADAIIASFPDK